MVTLQEFIAKIERTYGGNAYQAELRQLVASWAQRKTDRARRLIYSELVKEFSWRWGKLPSVAELEQAWKSVLTNRSDELDEPREELLQIEGTTEDVVDPEYAASFLRDLVTGMRSGRHPREVLDDYDGEL
ncbi:MAG: hypothetical protein ACLFS5_01895 [Spirochaetaceae bacterium]